MAIKPCEVEVCGKTLSFVKVGAIDGMAMTVQIAKAATPAITQFQNGGDIAAIAKAVVEGIESVELEKMLLKLFKESTIDGFPLNFNEYFAGNYGEMVAFLSVILEANFKSFFDKAALSAISSLFPNQ